MSHEQITEMVARVMFPLAEWESSNLAWVQCPGIDHHTTSNGRKDCRLTINDGMVPTLYCCHQSCSVEIANWNHRLRSKIGKLKVSAGNMMRVNRIALPGVSGRPAEVAQQYPIQKKPLQPQTIPAPINEGQRLHLETCFQPNELVSIVLGKGPEGKPKDKGQTLSPTPLEDDHDLGTFIRVNPMRSGGSGDADVTAWRHCLIEGDKAPVELQWAAIVASGLPVSVVVSSGGRSIHAWVRVDAATPEEYRVRAKMAADAMEEFEGIELDRACLNCSRLARLAGRKRGERRQELLAVNLGAACWDDWVAMRKIEEQPKNELPLPLPPTNPVAFYYRKAKKDFIMVRGRAIVPMTETGLKLAMKQEGIATDKEEVENAIYLTMTEGAIDYDGSMPGYPLGLHEEGGRRYYCDAGPTWFEGTQVPEEETGTSWNTIYRLTTQLLSPYIKGEQAPESKAWWHWIWALKMSREALKIAIAPLQAGERRQCRPGQAMVLCGPKNCGKSFVINNIVRPLLGGRQQDAHKAFSSGADSFNGELLQGEVWTVDDKEHSHRIDQRRQFGASIKSMMYSGRVGFHAKHKEQVTLQPWARLFILCNDQDEAIRVLPPLTPDIEDKLHLFRCYGAPTPMPTSTGAEWMAYERQIVSELPAFAGWLDSITLPERAKDQRNGSICWHDPHIVGLLSHQSPEHQLAQLLVHALDRSVLPQGATLGAMAILDALREDEGSRATARNLVHDDPAVLGRYLGRLLSDADRYQRSMGLSISTAGKVRGGTIYRLRLTACDDEREANS